MGIQISQICVLIKRILLDIKTRGINMCTKDPYKKAMRFFFPSDGPPFFYKIADPACKKI